MVALLRQRDDTYLDHDLAPAIWTLPVVMAPLGFAHIPLAPIVLPAFARRLIWRLARGEVRRPVVSGQASEQPIAVLGDLMAQQ